MELVPKEKCKSVSISINEDLLKNVNLTCKLYNISRSRFFELVTKHFFDTVKTVDNMEVILN